MNTKEGTSICAVENSDDDDDDNLIDSGLIRLIGHGLWIPMGDDDGQWK